MSENVFVKSGRVTNLCADGKTGTFTGDWIYKDAPKAAYQVVSTGASTTVFEASNDGVNACATALATITLGAAGSDGFTTDAPWKYVRARVTTNATAINITQSV